MNHKLKKKRNNDLFKSDNEIRLHLIEQVKSKNTFFDFLILEVEHI